MDREENIISKAWQFLQQKMKERWKEYETWVKDNPESLARVEYIFRTIAYASYMFTGAQPTEQVMAELIYALSNLLVFFNDNFLRKAFNMCRNTTVTEDRITKWLTVIEHVEVFLELAALRTGGNTRRWVVIAAVHVLRTILRIFLLFKYKSGIQPVPPLGTLKRDPKSFKQYHANSLLQINPSSESSLNENSRSTFVGQRSGRVIRTLDAAPDINRRTWRLPQEENANDLDRSIVVDQPTVLSGLPLVGEICHICRPIIHLCCLFAWGEQSWKPWLLAFAVDLANLYSMNQIPKLKPWEEEERKRRTLMMLFYLLRSPCYEKYSSSRLLAFLKTTERVWGFGAISKSLADYLPKWQKLYFYNWTQ